MSHRQKYYTNASLSYKKSRNKDKDELKTTANLVNAAAERDQCKSELAHCTKKRKPQHNKCLITVER